MGRAGSGVEIRERSIRFTFVEGKPRLMVNGEPARPTPANVKWAHRLAAEIRDKMRHGTFSLREYFPQAGVATGAPLTVGQQLDDWLAAQRVKTSTRKGYASVINFWRPLIGDKPVRALKHSDVLRALATRPDLSGKTVNNRVSVLRESLELAVLDKLVTDNAAGHVPSATWQRQPVDPFTTDEVERILAGLAGTPQVANYTAFKFFTGLRTGESFGLKWADVDLASGYMVVHASVVGGEELDSTKTSTPRKVLLNSRALDALQAQKSHTFLAGQHIFHDPRDGARWGGEPKFRWYWVPVLKRLGIRHRRPYNTRHTYATMMLMAGMTPAFCAKQLGHSRVIFDGTYAKWMDGDHDALEMAKFERSLDSSHQLPTAGSKNL
jgi:integrase